MTGYREPLAYLVTTEVGDFVFTRDQKAHAEHRANDFCNSSSFIELYRLSVAASAQQPIDMVLHCPSCGLQHIDAPEDRRTDLAGDEPWHNPPHRSHLCHGCGHIWRPADVPTNGVAAVKTKGKADSPIGASLVDQVEDARDAARYRAIRACGKEWSSLPVFDTRGALDAEALDEAADSLRARKDGEG